ncbi:MAG TPA: hypothetical protein VKN14_10650 [Flavobacteriaceae bacterium]|nr:hypothetical protein [Flavobacteriaceae bacterium]
MINETDKNLDRLVNKMMKDVFLETPSKNFETNVMASVNNLSVRKTLIYKPLISKSVWILLAFSFIVFMGYLIFGITWQDSESLISINFDYLFNNKITQMLSNIKFSNTFTYAIFSLAFMVVIQIRFLKHYFDKRLV